MADVDLGTALLTEHLRYAPVSLLDDIINSINELASRGVDSVESGLNSAPLASLGFTDTPAQKGHPAISAEDKAKLEIENGVHQLETLLCSAIDKNFDKMEIVALRSIIAVEEDLRDWVRLRHYEGLNFVLSPDAPSVETIATQRNQLRETRRLHTLLEAEASKNAALIAHLKSLRTAPITKLEDSDSNTETSAPFAYLAETGELSESSTSAPLSTRTAFALSQLPALRGLLADLRPQIKALTEITDSNVVKEGSSKSWRRERAEYVETQTRRHLETVAGLELGEQGDVRDGEWQGEGRNLLKGEVEDLEKVVAMVGGRAGDAGRMDERE